MACFVLFCFWVLAMNGLLGIAEETGRKRFVICLQKGKKIVNLLVNSDLYNFRWEEKKILENFDKL